MPENLDVLKITLASNKSTCLVSIPDDSNTNNMSPRDNYIFLKKNTNYVLLVTNINTVVSESTTYIHTYGLVG